MNEAYIIDYIRTPVGAYGGSLSSIRPDDMGAIPIKYLMENNPSINWEELDDVILGCANQAGEDNRNVAKMSALLAGLPHHSGGTTINRLCGSGMDAIGMAARSIKAGECDLIIAGGVESMSRAPFVMPKADTAFTRANNVYDTTIGWRFTNPKMHEMFGTDSMPETGENVAEEFQISREDQDKFAFNSQQKCKAATEAGFFKKEITPVTVKRRKQDDLIVDSDEHPKPNTTLEKLSTLRTPFKKEGGTVTAGNASGVNDGAGAMIIASKEAIEKYNLKPKAKIVMMTVAGVPPRIMGIGPLYSSKKILEKTGLTTEDMDVIELNEAFASQGLATLRGLGLADDEPKVNPNGGAISIGHPLGMSGARLVMTALNQLEQTNGRYGLCTMCIGVGQGISMIIENLQED
ncbi:3-oxoadipyl-CoA thiolase [Arcobacter sp. LA11]|uniref:3-oxoadipyl-CoA thiolase n=1 Tax=Arcobacter sp. LA11 TaxID=1898176 RepID=UPI00093266E0|nr:3-oxoadipyl-CoA thiolase [Arcobacter sp. LA11]